MNLTLNQTAKMAGIAAVILTTMGMGASAFVYSTEQAKKQGSLEQSVDDHTKRLQRIEDKIDKLTANVGSSPTQAIGFSQQDRPTLVRSK